MRELLAAFVLVGCGAESVVDVQEDRNAIVPDAPVILSGAQLVEYQDRLPLVAWKRLQELFDSSATLWFDKATVIPSYQDSVGDGSFTPIGARANNAGANIIVPQGRRLFTADGEHWSFPFGQTAGTDATPNKLIINFMSLPYEETDGSFFPVVYTTIDNNGALGGLGLHQWNWMYPRGTVMGEVIFIRDAANDLYPVEIRTRTRFLEGWAVNAFRPFPTAALLADGIKAARAGWASDPELAAVIQHLEDQSTLEPESLESPNFNDIFSQNGFIDRIPALDDDLVRELLTTTPFVSAYGQAWKADGSDLAFAASTNDTFSVVPAQNKTGLLEVRESSCVRCHEDAGRAIDDFEPNAILYGDIWGSDRIFSFHPWNQNRYSTFNTENREVRPEFAAASIVVRYDEATHTADRYRELPRP